MKSTLAALAIALLVTGTAAAGEPTTTAPASATKSVQTADAGKPGVRGFFERLFDVDNPGVAGTQWRDNARIGRVHPVGM